MHFISSLRWLALWPLMGAAVAQGAPAALTFSSALEGYQRFADEEPAPWRESNDKVRGIGGWREYAKEAAAATADAKNEAGAEVKVDPHAGHHPPATKDKP